MAKVMQATDGKWLFRCPGCKCGHWFQVSPLGPPTWTFNGDVERPTISPSILTWQGDLSRCHSFVTDGQIQFLSDCTHELAGQTVPLPDF
jgi:hypothetical protein